MAKDRKGRPENAADEAVQIKDTEVFELPIDGILDLHTFSPKEVKDLVPEYISECLSRHITEIRIIHGKGTGTLKAIVHGILKTDPRVVSFKDAGLDAGGWGATLVKLSEPQSGT